MNHLTGQNQILPISMSQQPVPSSFIIRQQQETLQRLQEQNQKQQQQIENLKNRYTHNVPNPISIRSQSPAHNLLTVPKSTTSMTQQNTIYDFHNNTNSSLYMRSSTPPHARQSGLNDTLQYTNGLQYQQGQPIAQIPTIIPVTYSNQLANTSQSAFSINTQQLPGNTGLINRPVYKVPRNIQAEYDPPIQINDKIPSNLSPQSMRVEQILAQQQQILPQISNAPIMIGSPENNRPVSYLSSPPPQQTLLQNGGQILTTIPRERLSFHNSQHDVQTVYLPIETTTKVELIPPPPQQYSVPANRFVGQETIKESALFPEGPSKAYQSSYRRQMNSSKDFSYKQYRDESQNKENEISHKAPTSFGGDTYKQYNDQYISREEHFKIKDKYMRQVEELEMQVNKLQNDHKSKNIDMDTQKSINEDLVKKHELQQLIYFNKLQKVKLENRIKELETTIDNLKEEQEKILDVCEKKDVEIEEQNLQLADKQREVSELKQKIDSMEEFYKDTQEKLQLYEDTQEELQNQIQGNINQESRNTFLNQEIQNSKKIIMELEQQLKQLQGNLPPVPYKQIEQETMQMQQYIQNLEQRLVLVNHEKNEEIQHWRQMAEIDTVKIFQEMESRCKFLANENERLNQIIVGRCIDMRQNW